MLDKGCSVSEGTYKWITTRILELKEFQEVTLLWNVGRSNLSSLSRRPVVGHHLGIWVYHFEIWDKSWNQGTLVVEVEESDRKRGKTRKGQKSAMHEINMRIGKMWQQTSLLIGYTYSWCGSSQVVIFIC